MFVCLGFFFFSTITNSGFVDNYDSISFKLCIFIVSSSINCLVLVTMILTFTQCQRSMRTPKALYLSKVRKRGIQRGLVVIW